MTGSKREFLRTAAFLTYLDEAMKSPWFFVMGSLVSVLHPGVLLWMTKHLYAHRSVIGTLVSAVRAVNEYLQAHRVGGFS